MGVFSSLIGLPNARGQSIGPSTLNATGGTAIAGGNTYDWSVGEMTMVSTFTGSTVIVTQGLLQPDSLHSSGVPSTALLQHLQVFPNPASSLLNLQMTASAAGTLSYRLMDMAGKVIITSTAKLPQGTTTQQIDISRIAAASYMLEVYYTTNGDNVETNSFKIEKLK